MLWLCNALDIGDSKLGTKVGGLSVSSGGQGQGPDLDYIYGYKFKRPDLETRWMSLYHDFATYNCVPLDKLLVSFLGLVICQFWLIL